MVHALPDLMEQADALLPELQQRSQEIDDLGMLPQELADRIAAMGFYKVIGPQEIGGLDLGTNFLCELVERLATANASVAWCVFIGATAHLNAGSMAEPVRGKMADRKAIVSGVFAPSGTALREETEQGPGYRINGHWKWGSSCHNAHWICGGLTEVDAKGNPVQGPQAATRVVFLPQEIEILDNWHVSGLKGTGSSDYIAKDLWLPAERVGTGERSGEFSDRRIYRFPLFGTLSVPIGAIALGMARACVDEVLVLAKEKTPQGSRRTLSQRPVLHRDVAIMDTKLRAARTLLFQTIDEIWQETKLRESNIHDRVAVRTANVHALNTAVEVIDRMYNIVGGSSVWSHSCLQRHFRDVHVASQHMMVGESVMELAGRVMLGLDDSAPGL